MLRVSTTAEEEQKDQLRGYETIWKSPYSPFFSKLLLFIWSEIFDGGSTVLLYGFALLGDFQIASYHLGFTT